MAEPAKFLYKYNPITDPEDFSDEKSWYFLNGESCYFLNKENPVKFKANNKVLLGVLKKVL